MINKKHKLFNLARKFGRSLDWNLYKSVRNNVQKSTCKAYWQYVNRLFEGDDNRGQFWSFVRSRKQSPPPPSFNHNNRKLTCPDKISSAFSDYFASVCKPSGPVPHNPPRCSLHIPELSHISVSASQIAATLKKLPSNKSPGPDGILPNILNKIAPEIAHPLCSLLSASLSTGQLPDDWRCANIRPVYKKGDKSLVTNYRTVALTSVLCKVLERIVSAAINDQLSAFGLLNSNQHGFVKHRSCVTQLVNIMHSWSSTLDKRRPPKSRCRFPRHVKGL